MLADSVWNRLHYPTAALIGVSTFGPGSTVSSAGPAGFGNCSALAGLLPGFAGYECPPPVPK
jgi:hypothetical protein